ncbi:MAG TPA: response regulator [Opitutus sp.]|nr:response regulator [Opitutus sp.]
MHLNQPGDKADPAQRPMRVLHLEDNPQDRELVRRAFDEAGLECSVEYAGSASEFVAALDRGAYDLILSDYSIPGYGGAAALALAREKCPEVPFLFVSGTIGEDRAIESLKNGATDYVLKNRLERLLPAVQRALREAAERMQRKQLEVSLAQAQKMEALGQLAGGVTHDFNNLLTVILGYSRLLLDTGGLTPEVNEALTQIYTAGTRAANLTKQLLVFSRKQAPDRRNLDIGAVVNDIARMLERLIGEHIKLQLAPAPGPLLIEADGGMMEQILMNLAVNARDAMPGGGVLTIAIEPLQVADPVARRHPAARAGEFVCLTVRDTGCGIPPENLGRIFEPFFTTKDSSRGTGLGLATVFGIVQQHQGWIEVESAVGAGTCFRVILPVAVHATEAIVGWRSPKTGVPRGGSETILLVEDEAAVREFAVSVLRGHGYRVLQASSGVEALETWKWHHDRIALLFTDLVLPDGLSGVELLERLRKDKPTLRLILTSGYPDSGNASRPFTPPRGAHFIHKPYRPQLLAQTVRNALDGVFQS